jgi:hypothetical protein
MDSYRRSLPVRGPELAILKERLESLAGPRKNLYYITAFNRSALFPEELIVLNDFHFEGFIRPSVFWFRRDGADQGPKR